MADQYYGDDHEFGENPDYDEGYDDGYDDAVQDAQEAWGMNGDDGWFEDEDGSCWRRHDEGDDDSNDDNSGDINYYNSTTNGR